MRYPCLVPKSLCRTVIHVRIEGEGLTEDGGPEILLDATFKCNYQDTAKRILTAEQKIVQITGTALLPGDIVPHIPVISGGEVTVFGATRRISQGTKARNPDGSVNYTRLDLV